VKDILSKLVGAAVIYGKGSWLKGLIVAMGLGAMVGGTAYVYPELGAELKSAWEQVSGNG